MRSTTKADKARRLLAEQNTSNVRMGISPPQNRTLGMQLVRDAIADKLSPKSQGRNSTAEARTAVAIADRQEVVKTVAILWIVVLNEEQDKQIPHTELVDSEVDFEEIPELEWEEELRLEDNHGI
ncbi:hypothetical protein FRB94_002503 [Tulasnella sp. JGI-2019a]|nr:hypothetical protein FRB94_002503 [Tulasnella sp. JGI-2019a]